jgi:3-dehydroquinate synthase
MNQEIKITTQSAQYSILLGGDFTDTLRKFLADRNYSKVMYLIDSNVAKNWPLNLENSMVIETSEDLKSVSSIEKIWQQMLNLGMDRKSLLVNIGGGVLCDMGGFAASTYMRGIDFVNCPTTLLAMVDASVGGKVGVNFAGIKNIIGSFDQPQAVLIDVNFLKTLPNEQMRSGMGEMLKHALIKSPEYLNDLLAEKKDWLDLVYKSCKIKAEVVMADEKEQGPRKILNFGHTIGHALEALCVHNKVGLTHGEAVVIGMVAESKLANLSGILSDQSLERVLAILKKAGMNIVSPIELNTSEMLRLMKSDKKNVSGTIKFSLISDIAKAVYDIEVDQDQILQAIKFINIK